MNRALTDADLPYIMKPHPVAFWALIAVCATPVLLGLWGLIKIQEWWPPLVFAEALSTCVLVAVFYGARWTKFVLAEDLLSNRYMFFEKKVALSDIIGVKIASKRMILTVRKGSKQQKISLNISLYDPKECKQILSMLNNLFTRQA